MPLVKCDTCKKEIADTAETCVHCGQEQPEKYFRTHPNSWVNCPKCWVKNYPVPQPCRNCGEPLDKACKRYEKERTARPWPIVFCLVGAVVGFLTGCAIEWLIVKETDFCSAGGFFAVIGTGVGWGLGAWARDYYVTR